MMLRCVSCLVLCSVACATAESAASPRSSAYVALMAGQRALQIRGCFNNVPVLHSNQPEIVTGKEILVNTESGSAIADETNAR